jgi:hypothetical protein
MPEPIKDPHPGTELFQNDPSYTEKEPTPYVKPPKDQRDKVAAIQAEAKKELLAPSPFTTQQTIFIEEYAARGSLKRACRVSGTPYALGRQWLENPVHEVLQAEIRGMQLGERRAHDMLVNKTMGVVKELLDMDVANFAKWSENGITVFTPEELKKAGISTKCIKSIKMGKYGVELTMCDINEVAKTAMLGLGLINRHPQIESDEEKGGNAAAVSLMEALQQGLEKRKKGQTEGAVDADFKVEPNGRSEQNPL